MANSSGSLGSGVELRTMIMQRGQDSFSPRPRPVQLDLLPLRPLSQTNNSSSLQPQLTQQLLKIASRTNSGSWNDEGEVETYTSGGHGTSSPRGIDMNQIPSNSDCDEEAVVSSPSSIGIKRDRSAEDKRGPHEFDLERTMICDMSSRGGSDDEDGGAVRKKLRLSKEQSALLEESFKEHSTLNPKQKNALAKTLNLRPRQVEVWFQNRRARTKLKQTEVECEVLKRYCETLTKENKRLHKDLQELRSIKVPSPRLISHDFYMPLPAATLTMCPSCERVATVDNRSMAFAKPGFSAHFSQSSAAC